MTKAELVAAIADDMESTKVDAEKFLNTTIQIIGQALKKGDSIPLVGFGTFSVVQRKARKGRNPQTGQTLNIPASKTVKFSVGKALKDTVNKR